MWRNVMLPPGGGRTHMGTLIRPLLVCWLLMVVHGEETEQEETRLLLTTKYGMLRGRRNMVMGTTRAVHAFLGIPFAKPPVGELRFASPQPPKPWTSIRDASYRRSMCLQSLKLLEDQKKFFLGEFPTPSLSEDCLVLDVYTPADRALPDHLPVLLFIHGGGFLIGGAAMLDGSALCAYENIVVVSIQYRLGILGFFSTGTKEAPGNYGLLDQVAALQWVQENIEVFGGDPRSVTIFGESAGGASVIAHVLSPLSRDLFHRAIAESGTILMPGILARTPDDLITTQKVVSFLSYCRMDHLVDCLKNKTEKELLEVSRVMGYTPLPACVDGLFFPNGPEEIFINQGYNVPLLTGVNDHEFGWLLPMSFNIGTLLGGMNKKMAELFLAALPDSVVPPTTIPIILDEYIGDATDPLEVRDRFLALCGDALMVIPALQTAIYHQDSGNKVYFYQFQHRPSMFKDLKPEYVKADHGDELPFVMGSPFMRSADFFKGSATDEERTLSKRLMRYWANFARTGNPNGPGQTDWPDHGQSDTYLEINLEQKAATNLAEDRFDFWTKTLPEQVQHMLEAPLPWQMLKTPEKPLHTEL